MLRKKICGLLAAIMVATTVLSGNVQVIGATELNNLSIVEMSEDKKIVDGEYEVDNTTEYIEPGNTTGEDMARKALKDKTIINVEDGKVTMTLKFSDTLYGFMKDIKVSLDGEDLNGVNNSQDKSITFEVPSVDSKVKVDMTISIMGRAVTFFVTNDTASLPIVEEDKVETPEETPGITLNDGTYKITNKTLKKGTDENSGIRNYIDTESVVDVNGDKITVTMKYNELGLETVRSTNAITIDGEEVPFVKNEDGSISFDVLTLDVLYSRINVSLTYYNESLPEFVFPGKLHTVDVELLHEGDFTKVEDTSDEEVSVLENGNYIVENSIYKLGTTQESMARQFIEDKTSVVVKDGKINMTIRYKGIGLTSIRSSIVKVNEEEVTVITNEDKSITFEVPSIDSKIELKMDIYVESAGFSEVQSVDFVNNTDSLTKVDDSNSGSDSENNSGNEDNSGSNNGGNGDSNNGSSNEGSTENQGTKLYTIKNEVTHENATGLSMARKALEEVSKVEEVNGKYYVTLTFTSMGSTMMKDHIVYVNGSKVETTKSVNGDIISLRFVVGSLEDSLKVSAFVEAMGSNVEFGVNVLEDTLTLVSDSTNDDTNTGGTTGDSSNQGSTNNGTTTDNTTTTTEEETKVTIGKLYSIKNNVIHESETGRSMARKYLNATSKVEEIEGTYYVTLTFTGSEFMQNHEIYVNGSKVSVTRNTSGDETYIRFAVSSLSDTIKVKTYVVPMSREVEFEVELLEDTLTFIKEYTVEKLPNTGAVAGAGVVLGLGLMLTATGSVLVKKRK